MSGEESTFWTTVEEESRERKGSDAKVYKRFLLIPMRDFREDWYEWANKNIKQMESRIRFLHRKANDRNLGDGAVTHVNNLADEIGKLKKALEEAKAKLDKVVVDPETDMSSPEQVDLLTDFSLSELFNNVLDVMRRLREIRNQVDLLTGFAKP